MAGFIASLVAGLAFGLSLGLYDALTISPMSGLETLIRFVLTVGFTAGLAVWLGLRHSKLRWQTSNSAAPVICLCA